MHGDPSGVCGNRRALDRVRPLTGPRRDELVCGTARRGALALLQPFPTRRERARSAIWDAIEARRFSRTRAARMPRRKQGGSAARRGRHREWLLRRRRTCRTARREERKAAVPPCLSVADLDRTHLGRLLYRRALGTANRCELRRWFGQWRGSKIGFM